MAAKITFLGAARSVTGSKYLVEHGGHKVLVDCGYFQEREFKDRNWADFPVPPNEIDAMVLTHAHLDHCGLIPRLAKMGFNGPIYATSATADIATIVMMDSGKIQEEDARYKQKRHEREGRKGPYPPEPLYKIEDAESASKLFSHVGFGVEKEILPGIRAEFREAGHILGASSIRLTLGEGEAQRRIVFSGDIGRSDVPIIRDPTGFTHADYVVIESTYGDRLHKDEVPVQEQMEKVINRAVEAGGNIIIPSFAVERSQDLMYHFNQLLSEGRIPSLLVFIDSPMAVRVTDVFKRHHELYDEETRKLLESGRHPCDFSGLHMVRTVAQSKAVNRIRGSAVVIAGSGMCTGGRIKHHLIANISRPESTILFVGYQAQGTLGRHILTRPETVRIHGQEREVHANIEQVHGFSGHADRDELLDWLSGVESKPRQVFVTHGEEKVAIKFSKKIEEQFGSPARVPKYLEEVELT